MNQALSLRQKLLTATTASVAALIAGCSSAPPSPSPATTPDAAADAPAPYAAGRVLAPGAVSPASRATSAKDYRRDAATHLYGKNSNRIYRGKMPPLLYAIGVLQVDVDNQGRIISTHWMRAPTHAPEVVAEIERTVRQAAPFPVPARLGRVTYTDTWLWHQSGQFQLDTLSEGQL